MERPRECSSFCIMARIIARNEGSVVVVSSGLSGSNRWDSSWDFVVT